MDAVAALHVLKPGPLTSVQDLGRPGFGRYGVPPAGAVDSLSLRIANLLVGNNQGEGALEITLTGLRVRALTRIVVAVTGADTRPSVGDAPLKMWACQTLAPGQVLSMRTAVKGCRAYLAIGGGVAVPRVMESKSTYLSSGFGGMEGRPLREGDVIFSDDPQSHLQAVGRVFPEALIPRFSKSWVLRVFPGPEADHFSEKTKTDFLAAAYGVTPLSDRTGIRLNGPVIQRLDGLSESIISEGVVAGAIQIPGDGQPIILLNETVTGGYRKIATVITVDLPSLGQMRPGDRVSFKAVSSEEAQEALTRREDALVSWMMTFERNQTPRKADRKRSD
jgi:antagonist of KipI